MVISRLLLLTLLIVAGGAPPALALAVKKEIASRRSMDGRSTRSIRRRYDRIPDAPFIDTYPVK